MRGAQAMLNFSLKTAPKNPVEFEILDPQGRVVRKLEAKAKDLVAGINRVKWDLRYDSPRVVALRTVAPDNPHIWEEPRFRDADSRPITHWGSKPGEVGPIAAPGTYSVRLKVDGQTYTQPLTILSDPHAPGSNADIDLSVKTLLQIRDDISHVSDTVNQMEWLRKQIEVVQAMLRPAQKPDKPKPAIVEEGDEPDTEPATAPPHGIDRSTARNRRTQLLTAAEESRQEAASGRVAAGLAGIAQQRRQVFRRALWRLSRSHLAQCRGRNRRRRCRRQRGFRPHARLSCNCCNRSKLMQPASTQTIGKSSKRICHHSIAH